MLCKETLGDSVEWLYDVTIGYPGIEQGKNPEDVMTMKRIFCERNGPHKIHAYIRRYRLDQLPSDTIQFSKWLLDTWTEKDKRLVYFNQYGKFPEETDIGEGEDERIYGNGRTFKVPISLQNTLWECLAYWLYFIIYIPIVYLIVYSMKSAYAAIM